MSNVWFTSDLHIGHRRIAASRTQRADGTPAYPDLNNIPEFFGDYEIHRINEIMADAWDETVYEADVVWVLGDISAGTTKGQEDALNWLRQRPGRKRLISGNHDGVHPMYRDANKWFPQYLEVFESISTAARIRIPLEGEQGHLSALLSHYPYDGDHTATDRHTQWRLRDEGLPIIHGHTHSTKRVSHSRGHSLQLHVGVDARGAHPTPLGDLAAVIQTKHKWEGKL
ncbi:metallophosphoesterase [Mycobacterium phage MrMagoo]|uniref:Metallophosphoesterase n=1 Tax=Mycobacterium phage MrMagoo TaxID=1927020 RepID=A0A1L6BYQ1_9CAUD|nr:phosphoesterase [Mycobacterium phage MrMagoo]APQ42226.1 metallophosphoesterase [Mycobacterium phage MrMagoo]ARM70296.1 metallophosphoesterase [Mycobacterium phage GardenSalsa]